MANVTFPAARVGFIGGKTQLTISSAFGWRRLRGDTQFHYGVDISIPSGTPLYAPFSGVIIVRKVQPRARRSAGLYVAIKSQLSDGTNFYCYMMHLHSVESGIVVNKPISQGDLIGTTGGAVNDQPNAGSSTGPHLHFEIRIGTTAKTNARDSAYFLAGHDLRKKTGGAYVPSSTLPPNATGSSLPPTVNQTTSTVTENTELMIETATEDDTVAPPPPRDTVAEGRPAIGIWQIVKLVVDSSVTGKQVCDSSIATQTGPLINFFNKVCQKPFVEFMGETYGNQYYFMLRRPPFDKEGWKKMLDLTATYIDESELIEMELSWSTQDTFSWYRYLPAGDLLGVQNAQFFIPAVFFPEYAVVWGSKPMCIESNYFNYLKGGIYNSLTDKEKESNALRIIKMALKDFKYLVESNAYNPFTRRGAVVVRGNRQIKRGTLVGLPTGEVFHVDAVSQTFNVTGGSVSRNTMLQLSHGIFPEYIDGVKSDDGTIRSYFNIIDFGDWDENKITFDNYKTMLSKWSVNPNVFRFFLRRIQTIPNEREQRRVRLGALEMGDVKVESNVL